MHCFKRQSVIWVIGVLVSVSLLGCMQSNKQVIKELEVTGVIEDVNDLISEYKLAYEMTVEHNLLSNNLDENEDEYRAVEGIITNGSNEISSIIGILNTFDETEYQEESLVMLEALEGVIRDSVFAGYETFRMLLLIQKDINDNTILIKESYKALIDSKIYENEAISQGFTEGINEIISTHKDYFSKINELTLESDFSTVDWTNEEIEVFRTETKEVINEIEAIGAQNEVDEEAKGLLLKVYDQAYELMIKYQLYISYVGDLDYDELLELNGIKMEDHYNQWKAMYQIER